MGRESRGGSVTTRLVEAVVEFPCPDVPPPSEKPMLKEASHTHFQFISSQHPI